MTRVDIVFSSTTQLASMIRAGDVSAAEVLEAHLHQIEQHNPALNAIVTMDIEQARKRAGEVDASLRRGEVWDYCMVYPAVVLPYTQDRDGLPIGVQIVGKRWCESHLLGVAKVLSAVTGEFQRPPGY